MDSPAANQEPDATRQATAEDRRASARYACVLETSCKPLKQAAGDAWPAQTLDLSAGGIALLVSRRFEPGTILTVRLESPDGEVTRNLLLRVVHACAEGEGTWRVGCALAGELNVEELRAFQAEPVRPPESDGRNWVRFASSMETRCRAVAPASLESWPTRVLDVSPGGMRLLVRRSFERGTLLSVEVPGSTESPPEHLLVRVLREQPSGPDLWILGCEMADQLADEDLQRFQ